jgi:hypothetical protein
VRRRGCCGGRKKDQAEKKKIRRKKKQGAEAPTPEKKKTKKKTHRALLAQVDGEAEIGELEGGPLAREQDVLGLDVAVHDPPGVQVVEHAQEGLEHQLHGHLFRQPPAITLQQAKKVAAVAVLEDQDDQIPLFKCGVKGHHVLVPKRSVEAHLAPDLVLVQGADRRHVVAF